MATTEGPHPGGESGSPQGGAVGGGTVRDPNWPAITATSGERPIVDPTVYLHPRTLARLGAFDLRAKMIVEGVTAGQHRSPYSGISIEFAQHRPYVPGDDPRHLDWKVYGRTDRLQIKQHQQETNLDVIVLVDSSGSMDYGSRDFADASGSGDSASPGGRANWTKFDHATALAAALGFITIRQGDRAGMVVFAEQIRSIVNRSSTRGTWRQIVDVLSVHPVDQQTSLARLFDQTLSKVNNRCLFALVSDCFDDLESIKTALARTKHRGHDLILFQTLDKAEVTFDFMDRAPFEGLEGEPILRLDPRAIRQDYLDAIGRHNQELARLCRSFGFDYQLVDTHDWLGPPLASFVAKRNAMMKRGKYG